MKFYATEPFDAAKQIRLLLIHPSDTTVAPIECSLEVHNLNSVREYSALSYAWGPPPNDSAVKVEGEELLVRATVSHALRRLRTTSSIFYLWIDVICINQSDKVEKARQVRLMGDIFRSASSVIVWLGDVEDAQNRAFDMMRFWSGFEARDKYLQNPDLFAEENPQRFDKEAWAAVQNALAASWWERMWVYQEYVVAKKIEFMHGNATLSEETFVSSLLTCSGLFEDTDAILPESHLLCFEKGVSGPAIELFVHRGKYLQSNQDDPLFRSDMSELQRSTHFRKTANARDKIYALIGLDHAKDFSIGIDYSASVADVYSRFTAEYIAKQKSVSIIADAGIGYESATGRLGNPTWVPDFRDTLLKNTRLFQGMFHCDKKTPSKFDLRLHNGELCCEGIIVDRLAQTWPLPGQDTDLIYELATIMAEKEGLHPSGVPWIQAFFKCTVLDDFRDEEDGEWCRSPIAVQTLIKNIVGFMYHLGHTVISQLREDRFAEEEQAILSSWAQTQVQNSCALVCSQWSFDTSRLNARTRDEDLLLPFLGTKDVGYRKWLDLASILQQMEWSRVGSFSARYAQQVSMNMVCQAFFTSQNGYMGIGPLFCRDGDLVCVVFGCAAPILLRPDPQGVCYEVVGRCYVPGLMLGEAVKEMEQGRLEKTNFRLI